MVMKTRVLEDAIVPNVFSMLRHVTVAITE